MRTNKFYIDFRSSDIIEENDSYLREKSTIQSTWILFPTHNFATHFFPLLFSPFPNTRFASFRNQQHPRYKLLYLVPYHTAPPATLRHPYLLYKRSVHFVHFARRLCWATSPPPLSPHSILSRETSTCYPLILTASVANYCHLVDFLLYHPSTSTREEIQNVALLGLFLWSSSSFVLYNHTSREVHSIYELAHRIDC